jgi:cytidylate kinase
VTSIHTTIPPLPVLLIVSGPPCAGKTTLARRLAAHFSLPLVTKDTIKETLFDTLGCGDRAWSKQLSGASMELLFRSAESQIAACRSCVIEGNFAAHLAGPTLLELKQRHPFEPVQIQLRTEASVLVQRLRRRALSRERHPGHLDQASLCTLRRETVRDRLDTIAIGGQLIELDTTEFGAVDYEALLAQISREHSQLNFVAEA